MITCPVVKLVDLLLVGTGGAIGSVLRMCVSSLVQNVGFWGPFPLGTLSVNVVGSAVLGLLGGLHDGGASFGAGTRLFVFIGILGGFTTFSTFSYETVALLRAGAASKAAVNVVASVLLCLLGVWLGYTIARMK